MQEIIQENISKTILMKEYHYLAEYDLESDSLILKKKINTNNYSHKRKVSLKKLNKEIKQLNIL